MSTDLQPRIEAALRNYVPPAALTEVAQMVTEYGFHLRITKERNSKHGDYRAPYKGDGHRISVNGSLNPFHFLMVFVHEVAHLVVQENHGRNVSPHGVEWKSAFQELMKPFLRKDVFPDDVLVGLIKHMKNPKAASQADPYLVRIFRNYDDGEIQLTVADVEFGTEFTLSNGRRFVKGEKQRTRYRCQEVETGKVYLVNGLAEVV